MNKNLNHKVDPDIFVNKKEILIIENKFSKHGYQRSKLFQLALY